MSESKALCGVAQVTTIELKHLQSKAALCDEMAEVLKKANATLERIAHDYGSADDIMEEPEAFGGTDDAAKRHPMLKSYKLKISTPFYTRWISQHAISETAARIMVQSSRVTVLEIMEA